MHLALTQAGGHPPHPGSVGDVIGLPVSPLFLLAPTDTLYHVGVGLPEYPEPNFGTKEKVEWDATSLSAQGPPA